MPEGYGVPETDEGMLDWSWAVERLEPALNYWFADHAPDGRPHAMPAWAVWLDGTLYFEGSPMTRRARNMAANPAVVVHLESGDDVVILEGRPARSASPSARWRSGSPPRSPRSTATTKYEYRPSPEQWDRGGLWAMRPAGRVRLDRLPARHDPMAASCDVETARDPCDMNTARST